MKKLLMLLIVIAANLSYGQFQIVSFREMAVVIATHSPGQEHGRETFNPPNWNHSLNLSDMLQIDGRLLWSESALLDYRSHTNPQQSYLGAIMTSLDDVFCSLPEERYAQSGALYEVVFTVQRDTQVRAYGQVGNQGQSVGDGYIPQRAALVLLVEVNTATRLCYCTTDDGHPRYFNQLVTLRAGMTYQFRVLVFTEARAARSTVDSRALVTGTALGYIRLPKQIAPDPLGFY